MEFSSALIVTFNDALVCLLPVIFFRRDGRPTPMWLLTALPYALAPAVTWGVFGNGLAGHTAYNSYLAYVGVVLSGVSIFMIAQTIGTHRVPLALWHQQPEREVPSQIVDWGIYRYIRHPFYSAFMVLMIANTLIAQHLLALLLLVYVAVILTLTARQEEKRLSAQPGKLGVHYRAYLRSTSRFFPVARRRPSAVEAS